MPTAAPIVIDLGRTTREHIEQLRAGAGPLVEEVGEVMRRIQERVGAGGEGRIFLPVVVFCEARDGKHGD